MTPEDFIAEVAKMRNEATKMIDKFRMADDDEEISELNYYHGQQVALNQVIYWYESIKP
jgi:hypothetical protein